MPHLFSFKVISYLLFLTVLDVTLCPVLRIHAVYPSLLYLLICYTAFEWGNRKTIYVAFWVGLFKDLLGGGPLGLETSILVVMSFALDFVVQKIQREFPGIYLLITFLFVFLSLMFKMIIAYFLEWLPMVSWEYMEAILFKALYTTLLLPIFYFVTERWFGNQSFLKQYELFR